MRARFFQPDESDQWDAFCTRAHGGTFLHTRRFLSYHGDRFTDCSVVLVEGVNWIGVMPAAYHATLDNVIVSHPGITYGGVLHCGKLRGTAMLAAFKAVSDLLLTIGARHLHYKAIPTIFQRAPAQEDLYALFRAGAIRYRCDLSSSIDLAHRLEISERRRRCHKAAKRHGLSVEHARSFHLESLWQILHENLFRKHGARPAHTLTEIGELWARFPDQIQVMVVLSNDGVEAGLVLFVTERVVHAQYVASNEAGHRHHALDLLFEDAIERSRSAGRRYFDFGISTEMQGLWLNEGLNRFKNEFGAGGVVHEFYDWNLEVKDAFE